MREKFLLQALDNKSTSSSTTVADSGNTNLALLLPENTEEGCDNSCTAGTERVSECNSSTVKVDLVLAQTAKLHICESDNTESLVDLESVNVLLLHTGVLDGLWHGEGGCGGEVHRGVLGFTPAENLCNRLEVELLELGLGNENEGGCTVGKGRGVGCSDGTVLLENRSKARGLGLVELRVYVSGGS